MANAWASQSCQKWTLMLVTSGGISLEWDSCNSYHKEWANHIHSPIKSKTIVPCWSVTIHLTPYFRVRQLELTQQDRVRQSDLVQHIKSSAALKQHAWHSSVHSVLMKGAKWQYQFSSRYQTDCFLIFNFFDSFHWVNTLYDGTVNSFSTLALSSELSN